MYLSEVAAVYSAYVDFCKQSNMHTDSNVSFGMLVWKKLIPSEGIVTKSGKRYHVVPSLRKCRKHWEESIIHQEVSWETAPRYDGDVERDLANSNVVEISKKLSENG